MIKTSTIKPSDVLEINALSVTKALPSKTGIGLTVRFLRTLRFLVRYTDNLSPTNVF